MAKNEYFSLKTSSESVTTFVKGYNQGCAQRRTLGVAKGCSRNLNVNIGVANLRFATPISMTKRYNFAIFREKMFLENVIESKKWVYTANKFFSCFFEKIVS